MRTESHLSTSPWSVPLLKHPHGAGSPSVGWKSERLVGKSHLSDLPRPIAFAGSALFASPVAIRTSPAARWGNLPAHRYCYRWRRPQLAVPSNCPILDFCLSSRPSVTSAGIGGVGRHPKLRHLSQAHHPSSSCANVPEPFSCNERCQRDAITLSFAPPNSRHQTKSAGTRGSLFGWRSNRPRGQSERIGHTRATPQFGAAEQGATRFDRARIPEGGTKLESGLLPTRAT